MHHCTAEDIEVQDLSRHRGDIEVLLVEDDPDDIYLMTRAMKSSDFNIDLAVCRNGQEALDRLRNKPPYESARMPNVIFLDLNMPAVDGRKFLEEIRKEHGLDSLPVVVVTTSTEPEVIKEAYRLGANSVVSKASSSEGMEDLMRTITQYWFKTSGIYYVD